MKHPGINLNVGYGWNNLMSFTKEGGTSVVASVNPNISSVLNPVIDQGVIFSCKNSLEGMWTTKVYDSVFDELLEKTS